MLKYRKRSISYPSYTRSFLLILLQQKACPFRLKINVTSILKLAGFSIKLQLSQSGLSRNLLLQRAIVYSQYVINRKYQPLQSMLSALVLLTIRLLLMYLRAYPLTSLVSTYPQGTGPYYYLFLLVVLKQLYIVG